MESAESSKLRKSAEMRKIGSMMYTYHGLMVKAISNLKKKGTRLICKKIEDLCIPLSTQKNKVGGRPKGKEKCVEMERIEVSLSMTGWK